jgi:hypothetical protein
MGHCQQYLCFYVSALLDQLVVQLGANSLDGACTALAADSFAVRMHCFVRPLCPALSLKT